MHQNSQDLDLITIGRSSVDLYGDQVGGRLEDMNSFSKYVGGSPTNIAIGAARLGLKSALITKVGDEHMGRYILEQLEREKVNIEGIKTDKKRLTALVLLGIKDEDTFPLIFYRSNCADMALVEDDIDAKFIQRAKTVLITGTHLSTPSTAKACLKALQLAKENNAKTVLDIDFRPNLWGLAGLDAGEERFIASKEVTNTIQEFLPLLDLIVGTEEEFHIASGVTDTLAGLKLIREKSNALLVCKRGTLGAVAFSGAIPKSLDEGDSVKGIEVEVFNVLGAGDGFMSGFLRGWINDEDITTSLQWANTCGAIAVSRHGCAPAYPSWEELQYFINNPSKEKELRKDQMLEHIHWSTTRPRYLKEVKTFAFDHRIQLEAIADKANASFDKINQFKRLCIQATCKVSNDQLGYGILCDNLYGKQALFDATGHNLWVARPVEIPGSCPVEFQVGPDLGSELITWPSDHIAKILCRSHPDDPKELWDAQITALQRLQDACRHTGHEILLEIILNREKEINNSTTAKIMERFYLANVKPEWWKLEPLQEDQAWQEINDVIAKYDQWCQGIVVLGMEAIIADLEKSFSLAAKYSYVKGFAVGRTIFAEVALNWLQEKISDDEAVTLMAKNYQELCDIWDRAKANN